MDTYRLTPEQEAVVCHSRGMHARVLAVAGSGKTTTMVHRVKHLVMGQGVPPRRICILMFNRLARIQFQDKLEEVGIPEAYRPHVNTFHSFAFGIISELKARGWLYGTAQMWVGIGRSLPGARCTKRSPIWLTPGQYCSMQLTPMRRWRR
ncbi:MAG: AAA family ATPase [Anaerolineae bacterium]|nr:AAA family ATPase [Anaerolineae bacterium]